MPKFYFHVVDGHARFDSAGTEFADFDAAKAHAANLAASVLCQDADTWPSPNGWQVMVADDEQTILATIRFSIERHE